MKAVRLLAGSLVLGMLGVLPGCCVPRWQLTQYQSQNRELTEQCRAQLAEIENLRIHSRNAADQLIRAEEGLALLEDQLGLDRKQLDNFREHQTALDAELKGLAAGGTRMPADVSQRLVELSQRYPGLQFDPVTGISKLDTDILFDSGSAELKPGAQRLLGELVGVLNSLETKDLKVMVVGHTDNRRIAKRPARERYPNNFHLSTARALAVADSMHRQGFSEQQIGVAGYSSHQPIAPNVTPKDRQKNRRVEIFVMNCSVPVVGWTDSIPSLY
jgi:flagellar motor protein MotB